MNLQSLKQRLSLRNISEALLRVFRRFPVTTGLLVALTAVLSSLVVTDTDPGRVMLCLLAFMSAGIVVSLAASLWGEEQRDRRRRWIVEGVSLAVCAVYCGLLFLTDIVPGRDLPAFYIGNAAWIVLVVLLVPFGSFLREKNDLKVWHFILSLCRALLISGVAAVVMAEGLVGLLLGTAALFDLEPGSRWTLLIMLVCAVLLFGMLFLALIPHSGRKHNATAEMPSFLTKIVSWLLLPLLGCYILVLYVYGINILVHWELPKGMISGLVSGVMAVYLLCYILLYPQVTDKSSWQSRVLTRWLPVAVLPLLVLMSVGVVRRFADYGITAPRLYLLTLLLWFYAVCVVMLVVPRKRFSWIALSFAALFVLSSGHPFHYYRLCRPCLSAKIDRQVAAKGLQVPFERALLYKGSSDDAELRELNEEITYMRLCYGEEYISRWVVQTEPLPAEEEPEELWSLSYSKSSGAYLSPQGYASFRWVNNSSDELPSQLTEDSILNGILHVPYNDAVLLFDTAAIRQAQQDNLPLILLSSDGKVAYSVQNISVSAASDHSVSLSYSGYVFAKEDSLLTNGSEDTEN